jgi:hypothetical protein
LLFHSNVENVLLLVTHLLCRLGAEVGQGGKLELVELLLHEEGADRRNRLSVPKFGKPDAQSYD